MSKDDEHKVHTEIGDDIIAELTATATTHLAAMLNQPLSEGLAYAALLEAVKVYMGVGMVPPALIAWVIVDRQDRLDITEADDEPRLRSMYGTKLVVLARRPAGRLYDD